MYGMFMRNAGRVLVYLLSFMAFAILVGFLSLSHFWVFLKAPGSPSLGVREVVITPGTGSRGIGRLLHEKGIISNPMLFSFLCWYRSAGQKLKAGEYAFLALSTPERILDQLVTGRVVLHKVTFPEGSTIRDVAAILHEKGLAPVQETLRIAGDSQSIQEFGIPAASLEGYLFPETYHFEKAMSAPFILKTMVNEFRRRLPESWEQNAEKLGLTLHQVVILASIVEKEAVLDGERPLIAAVFLNRLKRGMPLQSDPTAVYDLEDFRGPVEPIHLKRQSPYNTYWIKGLPPGPICNPGAKSIRAVLAPENVPYLYFVSNDDGSHQFSDSLEEHQKAVSRYYRKRKERQDEGGGEAPFRRGLLPQQPGEGGESR